MLELKNVSKIYDNDTDTLNNINLTIEEGS